jgi:putative metallohydrolase (TIGR04338 family)
MMTRDVDALVYAAEDCMIAAVGDRRFDSLADIRGYIRILVVQDWFLRRWPQPMQFTVRNGAGLRGYAQCATYDGIRFEICLPRKKWTHFVVLHEIAHACVWNSCFQDHGVMFREALLYLVRRRIGLNAYLLLQAQWQAAGLPC